jgi:hypothetical protein
MKVAVEVTVLLSGGDAVGEQDIERLLRIAGGTAPGNAPPSLQEAYHQTSFSSLTPSAQATWDRSRVLLG